MVREQRKIEYTNLCAEGKIKNLFAQPWWLDATGNWDVALAFRNNQLVGAFPYSIGRKFGIRYLGMPNLTHHIGIWMEKPQGISSQKWLSREKQIIWLLLDDLPRYGFFSMVFTNDSFNTWLPFLWKGFRQEMRYTFVIDQLDGDALDQQLSRNIKRNIREASDDLSIEQHIDPEKFFEICRSTYQRQKMNMPYNEDVFNRIDQAVVHHNAGRKLGAFTKDNSLVAVAYLLYDEDTAYYFLAGDNESGRSSGASIFLCREAIRIAFSEQKVKTFDFCGSMLEPIADIRRQFGARSVPLLKIYKASYRWLDILYRLTH